MCKCGVPRLSNLERTVIDRIWEGTEAEVTVRDVANELPRYAYTTVATVLDRMVAKGILRCRLVGRTKRYLAVGSSGAHTAVLMRDALAADQDPDAALRRFARSLTKEEATLLRDVLDEAVDR